MSRAGWHLAALGLLTAASCGGGQTRFNLFSTDWQDDGGVSIERVWQRVGAAAVPAATDVVVGIAGHSDKLIGLPLGGGSKWTFGHRLDSRPVVAGGVIVGSGGGEAFALEASSGRVIWQRPTGDVALLGAGDDGTVTVIAFKQAGPAGTTLLAVTHDGQVVRQIETNKPLGAPAVVGRMAFVPWAGQYVSVVDLANGDETARVTLRDETSRAWTQGGTLWFGQVGFTRFDEHIRDASKGKASYAPVRVTPLPGTPKLMPDGSIPIPAVANAEDKVRLYARPAATDAGAAVEDGRWYATYFRLAMGFDADAAKLVWVHLHGSDFLGGSAASGGVVLCDEQGKVTTLDARAGGVLSEVDLGEPLKACVVNIDGQRASGTPADTKPFATQLSDAVLVDDPQLVLAQRLLLKTLAAEEDESGTRALVDLASDPRTSPDLLLDARAALAKRRNGATYMETALGRHYDFLKDVLRPPPVGPIAEALGAMNEKAAAPLLAAHLLDPADTDDDIMRAAAALAVIASPKEAPALRQFFAMYRACASGDDMAAALASAGQALLAVDGAAGRAQVEAAVHDPSTIDTSKERLGELLAAPAAGKENAHSATDAGTKGPANAPKN
jgi:outer membrane protein assembly factor BamB